MAQSEAQKRAQAKYYAKLKEDQLYREDMARRQKEYYNRNKEKHLDTVKNIIKLIKKRFMNVLKRKENRIKLVLWLSWKI